MSTGFQKVGKLDYIRPYLRTKVINKVIAGRNYAGYRNMIHITSKLSNQSHVD